MNTPDPKKSPTHTLKLKPQLTAQSRTSALTPLSSPERHALSLMSPLPSSKEALSRRAYPMTLTELRRTIVTLLDHERLSDEQGDRLSPFFKVLGVGEEEERLVACFSAARPDRVRAQALAALFHSERGVSIFSALSDLERVSLCAPWVRPMMALASEELFPRFAIAALFQATPSEARLALLWRFERCRQEVGGRAASAYEVLLTQNELTCEERELLLEELSAVDELEGLAELMSRCEPALQALFESKLAEATRGVS